ncbi:TMEM175 family protein [Mucilaginibacter boryungensis]|uniref:DUF1211 domain-containing protein n=1 Tax=Mucilaginibacter boryungensis TaxID=768480 RepID=A0ABR9XD12_9SPHI|nr:TMEM175 family protein [Mucilaginibacter boryungensis]MBE9664945.1 DUF1211 domain-containing protein [Mucilaginibacter boryungensis]
MVRKKALHKKQPIEWRSHEPNRLETFSDAVFAFALTLIIVSIEVPKSFDDLYETMKGGVSFAACFAMLFLIWNSQNIFFRRYGLNDPLTVNLNGILLFVVLIYVYPMKFLSQLLFMGGHYVQEGKVMSMITRTDQTRTLMLIYGIGYCVIYLLFFLMYMNAKRKEVHLELTPKEAFETHTIAYINLFSVFIGMLAMALAIILPDNICGISGFTYFLIPIAYSVWFSYRGKKSRLAFAQ